MIQLCDIGTWGRGQEWMEVRGKQNYTGRTGIKTVFFSFLFFLNFNG